MPVIVPISLDRFIAVVMPFRHRKLKGSRVVEVAMITIAYGPALIMTLIRVTTLQLGLSKVSVINQL